MKQFSAFLVLIAMVLSQSGQAQNRSVSLHLMYLPLTEYSVGHASVDYFQVAGANQALGVKAMFSTNGLDVADGLQKQYMGNIDFVNRWAFVKNGGRYRFLLDAGLSISGVREINSGFYGGYCGVGMTLTQMERLDKEIYRKNHKVLFRSGIATAANVEFYITRHFGWGFGIVGNGYYSPKDRFQFLVLPTFHTAYSF